MSAARPGAEDPDDTRRLARLLADLDRLQRQNDELAERLLEAEQTAAERLEQNDELAERLLGAEQTAAKRLERDEEARALPVPLPSTRPGRPAPGADPEKLLEEVLSSESWRMTAPLRFAGRILRKLVPQKRAAGVSTPAVQTPAGSEPEGRRRLRRVAKAVLPARVRAYLRQRFPDAVETVLNPPVRSPAKSIDDLVAERFPLLRPLSLYPVPAAAGRHVTMVTDSVSAGSLFGGVGTAIILSTLLARRLDASLRVVTRTEQPDASSIATVLRAHGIAWDGPVELLHSPPGATSNGIPSDGSDVFLTTSWWSTRAALRAVDPGRIVYLLQEDERLFYPAGDVQLMCHEVLADDRIRFALNTHMLRDFFVEEGFENIRENGIAFEPAFPETIYYRDRKTDNRASSFFFYARPNNDRNLFLRGLEAVSASIARDILSPERWDFHFVGKDIPDVSLPYGVSPMCSENLPWPEYAALMRRVDVGLSLMSSPHPSYPPLDLAACGAVAVTNRFGRKRDLAQYSANIICADPTTEGLVAAISRAVDLADDDRQRTANEKSQGLTRSWEESLEPVVDTLARSL
jgi:hypothetical protein